MKKTKILITVGPASDNPATIERLIKAGTNMFRVNCSHASPKDIIKLTALIRSVSKKVEVPVAVVLDLQGPKMRVGEFDDGFIQLKKGAKLTLTVTDKKSDGSFIPVQYRDFHKDVSVGQRILLDDGNFSLKALSKNGKDVVARVIDAGILKNKKGINLPDTAVSTDPLTRKDLSDLKYGLQAGVDFVAISFVRSALEIRKLKKLISKTSPHTEVIAKIERHEAVQDIEAIVMESDAVMIARGDLGVELPAAKVPVIQLQIVQLCHYYSKPVIIATQMLESMIVSPRPTRAELSDVGNSVRFYVDAMMLSAETASGKHPVEAVTQMSNTAIEMEDYQNSFHKVMPWEWRHEKEPPKGRALAYSSCRLSELLKAKGLIIITETGFTAKQVASSHPNTPIYAFTPHKETMQKLSIVRNVTPFQHRFKGTLQENIAVIHDILKEKKLVKRGDPVVITGGLDLGVKGSTRMMMIEEVK